MNGLGFEEICRRLDNLANDKNKNIILFSKESCEGGSYEEFVKSLQFSDNDFKECMVSLLSGDLEDSTCWMRKVIFEQKIWGACNVSGEKKRAIKIDKMVVLIKHIALEAICKLRIKAIEYFCRNNNVIPTSSLSSFYTCRGDIELGMHEYFDKHFNKLNGVGKAKEQVSDYVATKAAWRYKKFLPFFVWKVFFESQNKNTKDLNKNAEDLNKNAEDLIENDEVLKLKPLYQRLGSFEDQTLDDYISRIAQFLINIESNKKNIDTQCMLCMFDDYSSGVKLIAETFCLANLFGLQFQSYGVSDKMLFNDFYMFKRRPFQLNFLELILLQEFIPAMRAEIRDYLSYKIDEINPAFKKIAVSENITISAISQLFISKFDNSVIRIMSCNHGYLNFTSKMLKSCNGSFNHIYDFNFIINRAIEDIQSQFIEYCIFPNEDQKTLRAKIKNEALLYKEIIDKTNNISIKGNSFVNIYKDVGRKLLTRKRIKDESCKWDNDNIFSDERQLYFYLYTAYNCIDINPLLFQGYFYLAYRLEFINSKYTLQKTNRKKQGDFFKKEIKLLNDKLERIGIKLLKRLIEEYKRMEKRKEELKEEY